MYLTTCKIQLRIMRSLSDSYHIYLNFFTMLDLCSDLKKKWNILKDFGLLSDSGFIDVYIHNFTVPCTMTKNVYKFENSQQIGYITLG